MTKTPPKAQSGNAANAKTAISPARLSAFRILQRVEADRAYASVLLAAQAEQLEQNDRALCQELVLGVLRNQLWLDRLIGHYAKRDSQRLDLPVLLALRLGLYQLRFLSRIPASAAVNESVKLVGFARLRSAEPFVNAVLRRATREPAYEPAGEIADLADPIEKLAVETSHPPWLLRRWADAFGFAEAQAFARSNNQVPPVAFRIVAKTEDAAEAVLAALRAAGGVIVRSALTPGAWRISGAAGLLHELAQKGDLYIQEEASQLVAQVVAALPGERVLDVCAAPGSKATHIADLGRPSFLLAGDIYEHRLHSVLAAAAAQRLDNIHCVTLDALRIIPFFEGTFDRVLVDAPCTGTGTLRRNPEIRWRITAADINDLAHRQLQILLNAASVVKPGGRLVYSTCSVELEENEQVITQFSESTSGFDQIVLPVNPSLITATGAARVWPHREGGDGFFVAAFQRRAGALGGSRLLAGADNGC